MDKIRESKSQLPPPVAYAFLTFLFLSAFRIFATLPFDSLHQWLSNAAIVIFTIFYLVKLIHNFRNEKISRIDLLIWVFIAVNLFAAFRGQAVFGQPVYFGLMAQRSVLLSLAGILLISMLINRLISIKQVERSFLIVSFLLLIVCYYFSLFVDPEIFPDEEFVAYSPIRGYRYRFQFALVVMLLFYSLFKVSQEKKSMWLIPAFAIIFYIVYFLQSRTTLVVLAGTLAIYFFRNLSMQQKVKNLIFFGGGISVLTAVLLALGYTNLLDRYALLFQNVLDAFIAQTPDEASAAVRYSEYRIALDYIAANPLLGNGFISNQWQGGWSSIFGYFYPVDIGLLGNIFVFGIIGTLIIYLPFLASYKMSKSIRSVSVFFKVCEYMLLFFFLNMFFSAANIRDSSSIMILVCLVYYFRFYGNTDRFVSESQATVKHESP